jgi:hypothetical protein
MRPCKHCGLSKGTCEELMVSCPKCRQMVRSCTAKRHMESMFCLIEANSLDPKDRGLVRLSDGAAEMLKQAGVPIECHLTRVASGCGGRFSHRQVISPQSWGPPEAIAIIERDEYSLDERMRALGMLREFMLKGSAA